MSKPKRSPLDWHGEAWRVFAIQQDIADGPGGLLGEPATLNAETVASLEAVQDRIADFINYTLYWRKPKWLPLRRGGRFTLSGRHPTTVQALYRMFSTDFRYEFKPNEEFAFIAHISIGRILVDQWADRETKQSLPLMIATIGGAGMVLTTHLAAVKSRPLSDQKGVLRRELARSIRNHPGETANELLHRLTGDGVVVGFDGTTVRYQDGDKVKSITLKHFENTFSSAKQDAERPRRKPG